MTRDETRRKPAGRSSSRNASLPAPPNAHQTKGSIRFGFSFGKKEKKKKKERRKNTIKQTEKLVSEVGFEPTPSFEDQNAHTRALRARCSLESGALDRSAILTCVVTHSRDIVSKRFVDSISTNPSTRNVEMTKWTSLRRFNVKSVPFSCRFSKYRHRRSIDNDDIESVSAGLTVATRHKTIARFHRDSNSDRRIQSPEC